MVYAGTGWTGGLAMKLRKLLNLVLAISIVAGIILSPAIFAEASGNVEIASVEVTQILGKGIDLDNGKYYFMNMFVAEKPTAIQVVMTGDTPAASVTLDIFYENSLLTTVGAQESGSSQILTFIPQKDLVGSWKAGRYKFTANANGSSKTTEAIFNESRRFSVLLIAASVKYDGEIFDAPDLDANTVPLRAQPLPVSESKFIRKFRSAKLRLGTGNDGYDLNSPEGQMGILADIEKYRATSASQYDVVVCVVNAPLTIGGRSSGASTAGYTDASHAVVMTLDGYPDAESKEATLLHELGHVFGNGDEYIGGDFALNVNGAPYGIEGTSNGRRVTGDKVYFKNVSGNDYSGIMIEDAQNPYNPKTATAMYNRTSFMGSSYRHWTTNMVWEQTYRFFIPNYNNVLPKVYTDGSIVAKRPNINDMSDMELDDLKASFRQMLNEVRAEKGLAPYPNDDMMRSGEKRLREVAEEALSKNDFGTIDLEPMLNSVRADTKHLFTIAQMESKLTEFTRDFTEEHRTFFSEHPCGNAWINDDYMFLSFTRAGNVTYIMWSTLSGAYPATPDEEEFEPQPETAPIPEVNPVTDKAIDPRDFADKYGDGTSPPAGGGDTNIWDDGGGENASNSDNSNNINNSNEGPATATTPPDAVSTNDAPNAPDGSTDTHETEPPPPPASDSYADVFRRGDRPGFFWDMYDYGLRKAIRDDSETAAQYSQIDRNEFDFTIGFYAWYIGECYGVSASPADIETAVSWGQNNVESEYYGEHLPFDYVCRYFGLYPPQELRQSHWQYEYGVEPEYGNNPRQSKYDRDAMTFREADYSGDWDVYDPDGDW